MDVTTAVKQRISTRAYTDTPIPQAELAEMLDIAQRAPSGGNVQPWRTIVVGGKARDAVVKLAGEKLAASPTGEPTDRPIYPPDLWEPHKSRRFRMGEMMYEKIGIPRDDKMARLQWFQRNYNFFNAPQALFVILDERMGHGQWGHTGMFIQTICLLAEERGWGTCLQECWGILRPSLKEHFGLGESEMVWCGISIGYPDKNDPVNTLYTERATPEEVVEFRGY